MEDAYFVYKHRKIINFVDHAKEKSILKIWLRKIMKFIDKAQKNYEFCQSGLENLQASSISYEKIADFLGKIANFIDQAQKKHEFRQSGIDRS